VVNPDAAKLVKFIDELVVLAGGRFDLTPKVGLAQVKI